MMSRHLVFALAFSSGDILVQSQSKIFKPCLICMKLYLSLSSILDRDENRKVKHRLMGMRPILVNLLAETAYRESCICTCLHNDVKFHLFYGRAPIETKNGIYRSMWLLTCNCFCLCKSKDCH